MRYLAAWTPELILTGIAVSALVWAYYRAFPANRRPPRWWWWD